MKKTNSGNTEQQGIFAEKVQILKGSRSGYIGKITCNKISKYLSGKSVEWEIFEETAENGTSDIYTNQKF